LQKDKGMTRAIQLGALLLLAHIAFAQTAANIGVKPVVTDLKISGQDSEVRIEIGATSVVSAASVSAAYGDRIAVDFPGVSYNREPRRTVVNKNGVKAVRIWQQSDTPPLTRMLVELYRPTPYLLSTEGNSVVLRIGARLPEQVQKAANEAAPSGKRQDGPAATGRTSSAVSAAQAVIDVFRRSEKSSPTQSADAPPVQPEPKLPALVFDPAAEETSQPAVNSPSAESISTAAQMPAPSATEESRVATAAQLNAPPPVPKEERLSSAPIVESPKPPSLPVVAEIPAPGVVEESKSPQPVAPANAAPEATELAVGPVTIVRESAATNAEPNAASSPPATAVEPAKTVPNIPAPDMAAVTETVTTGMRTSFQVKHVQDETAYLDGGRSSGLAEGMTLIIKGSAEKAKAEDTDDKDAKTEKSATGAPLAAAELVVIGVAETSAVAEIRAPQRAIVPGDIALLSSQDTQALVDQRTLGATRKYPAVITFTESDLLDEEARAYVPRPPLPSVNRMRGFIGADYMDTINRDSSQSRSSEVGAVLRADFTRIGGTYWNLSGYWRGRLNSFSASTQPTLQDLLNRTYYLELTYQNPNSPWVAGVGRMFLPWASSLNTIDGGYFGRRIGKIATIGIFGGSTPDPTSWNYNPEQKMGGTFVNLEGGSYEKIHFSSTSGIGVDLLKWQMQDPFVFFENTFTFKRIFSIYHSLQADRPAGNPAVPAPGAGISQSFFTARLAPVERLEFTFNHTYFRNVPTFDPTLIGTGLLDKYLFQGLSAGVRVEVVKKISLYTTLGDSNRTGDAARSINQLYGITFGKLPWLGLQADAHYSKFNSSFAGGTYRAVSVSKTFGDGFHLNVLAGDQSVLSTLAGNQSARFVTNTVDTSLGARFFVQGGLTFYRGQLQDYDQYSFTLGYRFDSREKIR